MLFIFSHWLDTPGILSPFFTRETIFVTSCLLSWTGIPSQKEVYSKRKEFAPRGSKFFPFRVDPFEDGDRIHFDRTASPESVSILLKEYSST